MAKKRVKRKNSQPNIFALGGVTQGLGVDLSKLGPLGSGGAAGTVGMQAAGGLAGGLGSMAGGVGGLLNSGVDMVKGLMNPSGNETGVGNVLSSVGSLASNIPGVGGIIGAGVNLIGGLVNSAFGSKINKEFVNQTEQQAAQQGSYASDASTNSDLLSDWAAHTDMSQVKKSDVGSDGWFSSKAKNKTKELNKEVKEANTLALASLDNTASNIDSQNDLSMLANYSAYGGPLNLYTDGGGIHIKKKNRGKFTEYCGGKVTSECIARGKRSSNPTTRKRATFAANARKWHALGGYLNNSQSPETLYQGAYDSISTYPNMFTHGGIFNTGVTTIGEGGTHEENPLNGVPVGVSPDGTPNLVEEGEVLFNDYVFSNRLKADENMIKQYNLPTKYKDKTFADIAKSINKAPSERPNDPISKRGLLANMAKLMQAQEEVRTKKDTNTNQYALGGPYKTYSNFKPIKDDWYSEPYMNFVNSLQEQDPQSIGWLDRINSGEFGDIGGNSFTDISDIKRLATDRKKGPVHNAMLAASQVYNDNINPSPYKLTISSEEQAIPSSLPQMPSSIDSQINNDINNDDSIDNNKEGFNPTWLRYAPALGAGLGVASDLLGWSNKPDYSNADLIANATSDMPRIEAKPISNYLAYKPFDRDYYQNKLNAQSGANRRAIQNTSGGNRANAQAGILASDYNYNNNLGNLARQAEEYNLAQRQQVEEFNRGTNQYNSESAMRAAMANQSNREMQLRGIMTAAQMREDANNRGNAAKSANLTNFFDSLGDIGREEFSRNMITSNPALDYDISRTGKVKYKNSKNSKNSKKKSKGGYLKYGK